MHTPHKRTDRRGGRKLSTRRGPRSAWRGRRPAPCAARRDLSTHKVKVKVGARRVGLKGSLKGSTGGRGGRTGHRQHAAQPHHDGGGDVESADGRRRDDQRQARDSHALPTPRATHRGKDSQQRRMTVVARWVDVPWPPPTARRRGRRRGPCGRSVSARGAASPTTPRPHPSRPGSARRR